MFIKKGNEFIGKVAQKVTEPIRDPKTAFSYWFDFDPRIIAGEKKNFNLVPLFASSPERGVGFGFMFAQESLWKKNDVIKVNAIQTLKNKSLYSFGYQLYPGMVQKISSEIGITYENYDRFYYGIGNQTERESKSDYLPEIFAVKVPFLYSLTPNIFLGLSLNFQNSTILAVGEKGVLKQELPNLFGKTGSRIYSSAFLVRWDNRNSKTDPSKGFFLQNDLEYSKKLSGDERDFTRTTLDIRAFYPLFQKQDQLFAGRLFLDYKSGDIPFFFLPELGGVFFNRGLFEGRFRDRLLLAGNWEYRLKIYQRLHWAFFVDVGNVYREFNQVTFTRTKITGGTGMRYYIPPGTLSLARIDGGYGVEGLQIYLTFEHPF